MLPQRLCIALQEQIGGVLRQKTLIGGFSGVIEDHLGGFQIFLVYHQLDAVAAHLDARIDAVEVHDDGLDTFGFETTLGDFGFVLIVEFFNDFHGGMIRV